MRLNIVMPAGTQRGGAELALLHLLCNHSTVSGVNDELQVAFLETGDMIQKVRSIPKHAELFAAGRLRQPINAIRTIRNLADWFKSVDTIALGWMSKAHLYAGPAALLSGTPAIWFQHALPTGQRMDRLATRIPAAGILTCSEFVAQAQSKLQPRRPTRVVYPGVDLERFHPEKLPKVIEARKQLALPSNVPIVGLAARMQRWKGVHVLLEAMETVWSQHPSAHCLIVGGEHKLEPGYEQAIYEQTHNLSRSDQVHLVGHQSNVPLWMQAMDVVVHASDREPFGMVVIEAMALGKPVVATVPGGPSEVITDRVNGQLVDYGDTSALANAINRYLDNPDFSSFCGENARIRAKDFSVEGFANSVITAVKELVESSEAKNHNA